MESKITLRDIFSYFLVGFYFLACLVSTPLGISKAALGTNDLSKFLCLVIEASKEISSAVLLLVPLVYLIGVIVHGVDNMVQFAALRSFELIQTYNQSKVDDQPKVDNQSEEDDHSEEDNKSKEDKKPGFVGVLLSLFLGSWAPYRAGLKSLQEKSGGDSMYGQGQVYWMIAFQANEGLYRVSWLYALYHLCYTHDWLKVGVFLFLVLLFWLRGYIIITEDLLKAEHDKAAR